MRTKCFVSILGKVNFKQMEKSLTVKKAKLVDMPMYETLYELDIDEKYIRTPINYNDLDNIGHGPNMPKQRLDRSISTT